MKRKPRFVPRKSVKRSSANADVVKAAGLITGNRNIIHRRVDPLIPGTNPWLHQAEVVLMTKISATTRFFIVSTFKTHFKQKKASATKKLTLFKVNLPTTTNEQASSKDIEEEKADDTTESVDKEPTSV